MARVKGESDAIRTINGHLHPFCNIAYETSDCKSDDKKSA